MLQDEIDIFHRIDKIAKDIKITDHFGDLIEIPIENHLLVSW